MAAPTRASLTAQLQTPKNGAQLNQTKAGSVALAWRTTGAWPCPLRGATLTSTRRPEAEGVPVLVGPAPLACALWPALICVAREARVTEALVLSLPGGTCVTRALPLSHFHTRACQCWWRCVPVTWTIQVTAFINLARTIRAMQARERGGRIKCTGPGL